MNKETKEVSLREYLEMKNAYDTIKQILLMNDKDYLSLKENTICNDCIMKWIDEKRKLINT